MRCHLKRCIQSRLDDKDARVEMRSFPLPAELRSHMLIEWTDQGEAMFHDICWKAIVDSYKMDNPFSFGDDEMRMIREAWRTAEYFDSLQKIRQQSERIAQMIREANYIIAFTGAGISTSAGICDFRGKSGKWTERDREKLLGESKLNPPKTVKQDASSPPRAPTGTPSVSSSGESSPLKEPPQKDNNNQDTRTFDYETRRPTYTHEALYKLLEDGFIHHIISQNTDGLHRLSGIPKEHISELHGNSFVEKCEKCTTRYERQFAVRRNSESQTAPKLCGHCLNNHMTGRFCEMEDCDGELSNTIINFGDGLEHSVLSTAENHARQADLVICLGSSLCVRPACDLIGAGKKPVKLVMCNRQPTPFDVLCYYKPEDSNDMMGVRVFGDCDILVEKIMEALYEKEKLDSWETERPARIAQYSEQRLTLEEALRQGSMPKTPKQPTKTEWPQPDANSDQPRRKSTVSDTDGGILAVDGVPCARPQSMRAPGKIISPTSPASCLTSPTQPPPGSLTSATQHHSVTSPVAPSPVPLTSPIQSSGHVTSPTSPTDCDNNPSDGHLYSCISDLPRALDSTLPKAPPRKHSSTITDERNANRPVKHVVH